MNVNVDVDVDDTDKLTLIASGLYAAANESAAAYRAYVERHVAEDYCYSDAAHRYVLRG